MRSYVVTGGRTRPEGAALDPATLVEAAVIGSAPGLDPDQRRVLDMCRGGGLSVAEIAGHARLPMTAALIVVGDLIAGGQLAARATSRPTELPSVELMQEVLDGLRNLAV
ncbi:DUF742 domain-containing protein [Amycolatopsis antarctica]|uniref:DUF742 domain-containing protein n=1 Tax=Amycolatopsis antarctica TaxID=1854586 RepID=UPI00196A7795|nr:DUF742 domain-containing protein [Amycolatopsis antarctica]